jgi:hypothetical protein
MCALGWAAYTWLSTALSEPLARNALLTVLDEGGGPEATQRRFDYVANFAITGRLVFLALGATLLGVKLRSNLQAPVAAALLLAVTCGEARAGSISVSGKSEGFDVAASIRHEPDAEPEALPLSGDNYVYRVGDADFAASAYVEKLFVIEWKPKVPDVPAVGVKAFTVEIPVILRKWRKDENRRIDARPFIGVGQKALHDYEWMREPQGRWTRFLASLQQSDHYARRQSPDSGLARRALNTAVSALFEIAKTGWVLPPQDLRQRLDASFQDADPRRHHSLSAAVDHVESWIWTDLPGIDRELKGEPCDVVEKTFDYLAGRKAKNESAYALQLSGTPNLLAAKREAALVACAADASPSAAR